MNSLGILGDLTNATASTALGVGPQLHQVLASHEPVHGAVLVVLGSVLELLKLHALAELALVVATSPALLHVLGRHRADALVAHTHAINHSDESQPT